MIYRTVLTLLALAATGLAPAYAQDNRIALLIGNADYKRAAPLNTPANDVADLGAALTSIGFSVSTLTNASGEEMRKAIADFAARSKESSLAVLFYAGHGAQSGGDNWILPIDAGAKNASEIAKNGMSFRSLISGLGAAGRPVVVLFNASREFSRSASNSGLAIADAPERFVVAYSTAPGSKSIDGDARNSPYVAALLKHIRTPALEIHQMFRKVRIEVSDLTRGRQIPWESSSLTGDLFLVPAR